MDSDDLDLLLTEELAILKIDDVRAESVRRLARQTFEAGTAISAPSSPSSLKTAYRRVESGAVYAIAAINFAAAIISIFTILG